MFTEIDEAAINDLLSKYCEQEIHSGKCYADKCDTCAVHKARQKIVHGEDDAGEEA